MASDTDSYDETYASDDSYIDELEVPNPQASCQSIQPYRFEPYDENYDEENGDTMQDQHRQAEPTPSRLENNSWCSCECCIMMPSERECVCCAEIPQITAEIERLDSSITCITHHPGFRTVCLDVFVLKTAYLYYRQQYGPLNMETHEMLRYTAYRQLVRWCWKYLGREVRVVLPACAVNAIRTAFPSDQTYRGFLPACSE